MTAVRARKIGKLIYCFVDCRVKTSRGSNANINMGITNLLPFKKTVTIVANLNSFAGKIATVDASCWMHKGLAISLKGIWR